MINVFFSYSHIDKKIREDIDKHLSVLKRSNIIETWYDNEIPAGDDFDHVIKEELEKADIILLLVSADFLHSSYCQDVEMKRALQKYRSGEAKVIPIIVDTCDWRHTELGNLKSIPTNGKEITKYRNRREAYQNITNEIRDIAFSLNKPANYYTKKAIKNSSKNIINVILYSKKIIKFIKNKIKLIIITLIAFYLMISIIKEYYNKKEIEEIAFLEQDNKLSINFDLNKDGFIDKASFIDWRYPTKQQGLYIFLSDVKTGKYKLALHKSDEIWSEGNPPGDIWLSTNSSGSLVVNFNEFMSSDLKFKVLVAFKMDSLVVAGYTRKIGSNIMCDINYMTGTYIVDGKADFYSKQFITLNEWNIGLLPSTCR